MKRFERYLLVFWATYNVSTLAACGGPKAQFAGEVTKATLVPANPTVDTKPQDPPVEVSAVTIAPEEVPNYKSVIRLLDEAGVAIPEDVRAEVMNLEDPETSNATDQVYSETGHGSAGDGLALADWGIFGRKSSNQRSGGGVRSINLSARTTNTLAKLVGIVPSSVVNGILSTPLGALLCLPNGILLVTNPSGTSVDINNKANCLRVSGTFTKAYGNGRSCLSCHSPLDSWGLNIRNINQRFNASRGNDPLFRPIDGANCPKADVSSPEAKRKSYSLLLTKGLIRVEQKIPAAAEFKLQASTGTYCNEIDPTKPVLSLYRRPLPTTNLDVITSVMWDGRESTTGDLRKDLFNQAKDAILTHAEAKAVPSDREVNDAVDLETVITSAQITSNKGFSLSSTNESAAQILARQKLTPNSNMSPFNPDVFTLFNAFANSDNANQRALYRGQQIFNRRTFNVVGLGANTTCSTCHNAANVGSNTAVPGRFFNNGVAEEEYRSADMPLYTLVSNDGKKTIKVTDPGRALVTGKWEDIGKFKVPGLRGMAAREPYFHNGSASTLGDVVEFYDEHFEIGLTMEEKLDLKAFLEQL